jgi:beta-phosphoglucomutase-like phosphatase (HAD superfamily)
MTIDAFIFDLDGTLVDTELLWAEAMRVYLAERRCECSKDALLHMVFGRSWMDIYRDITSRFPTLSATASHTMAEGLREVYLRLREQGDSVVIHSSSALLKKLAESHPVIIVSGSPHADVEEAVRLLDAASAVRFVLGAEDYAPGKPSPAGFLLGAQRLGVPPERCLVFEDSGAGVAAAKAAGMWCVALSRPCAHPQDISPADWILTDLADFSVESFRRRVRAGS